MVVGVKAEVDWETVETVETMEEAKAGAAEEAVTGLVDLAVAMVASLDLGADSEDTGVTVVAQEIQEARGASEAMQEGMSPY